MLDRAQCETLWHYIKPIETCMLVSHTPEFMHARPMHHLNEPFTGKLYFFTKSTGAKNSEIATDHNVCATYTNNKDVWVSLSAQAELTRDQAMIDKHWNPYTAAWFPEGKDSPDVMLLVLHVFKAEYWDADNTLLQLFHIAKANLTKTMPDVGENRKLG